MTIPFIRGMAGKFGPGKPTNRENVPADMWRKIEGNWQQSPFKEPVEKLTLNRLNNLESLLHAQVNQLGMN